MKYQETLSIVKALADASRLRILDALLEQPRYVEELSERLNLSASTVSFHLKKLEQARLIHKVKEQYYVMFHANRDALALTLRDLITVEDAEKSAQEARMNDYKTRVLETFFERGKLRQLPIQQKKRRIVLEELAKRFQAGRAYAEQEVNDLISSAYHDYCTARRELVDVGIFERNGDAYQLADAHSASAASPKKQRRTRTMDRRAELKQAYKDHPPLAGVYQIKNLANGKIFIGGRMNVEGALNSHRFQLKVGSHRNNALQQDWNAYGAEQFSFEILDTLKPDDDPNRNLREDVAALEELWREKLQPYGERGYNAPPKQR